MILVTGAAGFAGGHLLDLLCQQDAPIAAWHRPGGAPTGERRGVTWHAVDVTDREAVAGAIADIKPNAVYHCAGQAHVGRSNDRTTSTFAINVRGTYYLLEELRRAGVRARIVVPSSAMIYASAGDPLSEDDPLVPHGAYAVSKLAQEMTALRGREDGLHVTIARAFNHTGPRQDPFFAASGFARRIADIEAGRWAPEIAVGNLEARRDIHDVRDTVRAYQLILQNGTDGRAYNVCSGRAIQIGALLEKLLSRARVRINVRVDPARYRPNDVPLLVGDPTRVQTELGWLPEISLDQTLDDLLGYWRARASSMS
ncbi:MAG TPA: GDP-mannose 4,6-dehydratase [Vicinamibacterales bacterium]|nr:GDP-mannose 4,6-dehydratase [Vicinamibacterales bacterium]